MAKKINEEHMAKMFSGFGLTCNSPIPPTDEPIATDSVPQTQETKPIAKEEQEHSPSVSTKKSKPKTDRVSFMCRISETNLLKIRILSATSGKSLSDFIDYSITEYLTNHSEEYGNLLSRVQ